MGLSARLGRHLVLTLSLLFASAVAVPAGARSPLDCPSRDLPYSVDSALIDVLISPRAKAVLDRDLPTLAQGMPARFLGTTTPSFASILTPRTLAALKRMPDSGLAALDRDLRAVPLTAADREARCARYDADQPVIQVPPGRPRLLLFEKITGFRDDPSVAAAHTALLAMARRNGWAMVTTDKGGAITPANLRRFDALIWNNISGDVLTLTQRTAFRRYIEQGGGFVGFHGSGGDPTYFWDWYADTLLGARFLGHPMGPQFQDARVRIEDGAGGIARGLPAEWTMNDEWYSFKSDPRRGGAHVIATLDEASYSPVEMGRDIRMGDHPIAWTRCVGDGRSFYSAIGHRPETYAEPHHVRLLEQAIAWAAGAGETRCRAGKEVNQPSRR